MPINILLDLIRRRRGLEWGTPAIRLTVPYLLAASTCTTGRIRVTQAGPAVGSLERPEIHRHGTSQPASLGQVRFQGAGAKCGARRARVSVGAIAQVKHQAMELVPSSW